MRCNDESSYLPVRASRHWRCHWRGNRHIFSDTGSKVLITDKGGEQGAKTALKRKIAYYRAPMDGSVTSPVPLKDPMGMDYVPVYEEESGAVLAPGVISISPERYKRRA